MHKKAAGAFFPSVTQLWRILIIKITSFRCVKAEWWHEIEKCTHQGEELYDKFDGQWHDRKSHLLNNGEGRGLHGQSVLHQLCQPLLQSVPALVFSDIAATTVQTAELTASCTALTWLTLIISTRTTTTHELSLQTKEAKKKKNIYDFFFPVLKFSTVIKLADSWNLNVLTLKWWGGGKQGWKEDNIFRGITVFILLIQKKSNYNEKCF